MKKSIILLFILLFSYRLYANPLQFAWQDKNDKWKLYNTILQGALYSLVFVDYCQTLNVIKHPDKYTEKNPIIGPYPDRKDIILLKISYLTIHTTIAYIFPQIPRLMWQSIFIGIEGKNIMMNFQITTDLYFP